MKKFLLFLAILIDIVSAIDRVAYGMFIVSPRARKLSPHSSHNKVMKSPHLIALTAISESEQKQEIEQKAASQPVEIKVSQLVSKEAQELGFWAGVCDKKYLAEALAAAKDANVFIDVDCKTALHKITGTVFDTEKEQQEQLDCIQLLLKCGAKINQQDKFGNSPLHVAASCGNFECVKYLVEKGAFVNSRRCDVGWTPLFMAVVYSRFCTKISELRPFIAIIDWLITYGKADYTLNGGFELGPSWGEDRRTPFEAVYWDEIKIVMQKAITSHVITQNAIQEAFQEFKQEHKAAEEKKKADALQELMRERKMAEEKKAAGALQEKVARERAAAMRAFERDFGDDDDDI